LIRTEHLVGNLPNVGGIKPVKIMIIVEIIRMQMDFLKSIRHKKFDIMI